MAFHGRSESSISSAAAANRTVLRDREELSAGHLGDQIEANLEASAGLIVVCSSNGAASPCVQKEIEFFAAQGRHAKIFAIIPDTAPLTDDTGADCAQSRFPPAFRGDALSDKREPLAADARKVKDGLRNAWLSGRLEFVERCSVESGAVELSRVVKHARKCVALHNRQQAWV